MKITAQTWHARNAAPAPARPQRGGDFARLLENGMSADGIVASRALSFAETGLLGVHQAVTAKAIAVAETESRAPWPTAGRVPKIEQSAAQMQTLGEREPKTGAVSSAVSSPGGGSVFAAATATVVMPEGPALSLSNQVFCAATVAATDAATLSRVVGAHEEPIVSAPRVRDRRATICETGNAMYLRLSDTTDGAVAISTDLTFDPAEMNEITLLARTVGERFGVTVKRVVASVRWND